MAEPEVIEMVFLPIAFHKAVEEPASELLSLFQVNALTVAELNT